MDVLFEVSQICYRTVFSQSTSKSLFLSVIFSFFFLSEPATVGTCNKAALSRIRSSLSAIVRTLSSLVGAGGDEMNNGTSESSVSGEH